MAIGTRSWRTGSAALLGCVMLAAAAAGFPARAQREVFSTEEICRKNFQTAQEYKKNHRYREAEEFFRLVVETCPERLDAYLNLGEILRALDRFGEAIEIYRRALEVDPRNVDAKEALAYTYGAAGELQKSIDVYQEVLDEYPERRGIFKNLWYLYDRQGSWPEAHMMAKRVLAIDTTDVMLLQTVARKALDRNLYLEAMNLYEKLYQMRPDDPAVLRILGYFYFQVGLAEKAIPIYRRVLEMEPESESALFEHKILALSLKNAGQALAAAKEYEEIIEREPDNMENWYNLGLMYADAKAYEKAKEAVRRGLEQDPTFACLHYVTGKVYEAQGEDAQAGERFDEAIGFFRQAKAQFERCVNGTFCGRQCKGEIERMELLAERALKQKQKKEMEG